MVRIQCRGRRYLEVEQREDGDYEVRIFLRRGDGDKLIATPVVPPEEFDKLLTFVLD